MGAQCIIEIYRTEENKELNKFECVVTISYFGQEATLQGLSGNFNLKSASEIKNYLRSKGISKIRYIRRGKLCVINDKNKCED